MNRWILRAVWIPSLLALAGMTVLFAKSGPRVIAPAPLKLVSISDKSLALHAPGNWKPKIVSSHAVMSSITFKPDKTQYFEIESDLTGSLVAEMSRSSGAQAEAFQGMPGFGGSTGMLPNDPKKTPLEKLHDRYGAMLKENYLEYTEGKTEHTQIAGQEALQTDFTYKTRDFFDSKTMTGRRLTALTGERSVTVEYRCIETRKKDLFPVFVKMVKSVQIAQ
jgi:hypothetical protein